MIRRKISSTQIKIKTFNKEKCLRLMLKRFSQTKATCQKMLLKVREAKQRM